jgi:hypothetical protein
MVFETEIGSGVRNQRRNSAEPPRLLATKLVITLATNCIKNQSKIFCILWVGPTDKSRNKSAGTSELFLVALPGEPNIERYIYATISCRTTDRGYLSFSNSTDRLSVNLRVNQLSFLKIRFRQSGVYPDCTTSPSCGGSVTLPRCHKCQSSRIKPVKLRETTV